MSSAFFTTSVYHLEKSSSMEVMSSTIFFCCAIGYRFLSGSCFLEEKHPDKASGCPFYLQVKDQPP